jgi:GTP cyclohydrolase II
MGFGKFLDVPLPTYYGKTIISVLPEKVLLGYDEEGHEVHWLRENTAIVPRWGQGIYTLTKEFSKDLFHLGNSRSSDAPVSRHSQILRHRGIVINIEEASAADLARLRKGLKTIVYNSPMSSREEIVEAFKNHLNLRDRESNLHWLWRQAANIFDHVRGYRTAEDPGPQLTIHQHDEVIDLDLTQQALRALFPGDAARVKGKQPRFRKNLSHYAIIAKGAKGSEDARAAPEVRVHSECFTGDYLGSKRCDCGPQFHESLRRILKKGGAIFVHASEGRGLHSLALKMLCYKWHLEGINTYESMRRLGYEDDCRNFDSIAGFMRQLGYRTVQLITNNTTKISRLMRAGIRVVGRQDIVVGHVEDNAKYIDAKAGHGHDFTGKQNLSLEECAKAASKELAKQVGKRARTPARHTRVSPRHNGYRKGLKAAA